MLPGQNVLFIPFSIPLWKALFKKCIELQSFGAGGRKQQRVFFINGLVLRNTGL